MNKGEMLKKTEEYMDYITQHKKNVCIAWAELRKALTNIELLMRPSIVSSMEYRTRCHDESKFSEEEFLAYRQHFYPADGEQVNDQEFQRAWESHYRRNDHHWQYWIDEDGNFVTSYSVDEKICAYLEMICDWQAMGYVFGGNAPSYYEAHKTEIKIDPGWVSFVEEILSAFSDYLNGANT